MVEVLRQLGEVLGARARRKAYIVFLLVLLMAIVEAVGVASIMPFISVLSDPGVVESNQYLAMINDYLGFRTTEGFLFFLGIATFTLLMSSILIRALTLWAQLRFTNEQIHAVGSRLVKHYLGQPYQWYLSRRTSDIGVNVLSEVTNVIQGVVSQFMFLVANAVVALLLFLLLIAVDPLLALAVTLVLGGAYAMVFIAVNRFLGRIGNERVEANRGRFKVVQEAFGGIKDVKVNGLESTFLNRFLGPSRRMARLSTAGALVRELPSFAMQAVVFGGMLMVVLYLIWAHGTFQNALPYVALYALAGYRLMPTLQGAYKNLSELRFNLPALHALTRDFSDFHSESSLLGDATGIPMGRETPLGLNEGLELRQVYFRYEGAERLALQNICLSVRAHTTVALVGSTGSGKTTLVDVLLGLLTVETGDVLVDGKRLDTCRLRAWQRTVGYVPQNVFLADDTVAGNIAFGISEAEIDMSAVKRAARTANLHEFVSKELPRGYDTEIGERGVRLSGGQRQRIGIARALYHDPEFLVFDEATSALDNLTEHAVMDAVRQLGRKKTIVLVAHRLSTVRVCDKIFLLDQGRIIAEGTYDELLEGSEHFRQMATTGLD